MSEPKNTYLANVEITATEFKNNLGKYLDLATEKHECVITKNGSKIARLVPYFQDFTGYMVAMEEAAKYEYHSKIVSYEEFLEIRSTVEGRMEFINGEIIMQSSPNSFHQEIVGNLYVILKYFLKGKSCKVILAPFDVTLYKKDITTPDVIQPDLLIACDTAETINDEGRYSGTPTLVIEVLSPSTRAKDMVDKLNSFMRSGVKEYWIIDVKLQRLMFYSFKDFSIDTYEIYSIGSAFRSIAFPDLEIILADVFEY